MVGLGKGPVLVQSLDTVFWRDSGQVLLFFGAGGARDESSGRAKGKGNLLSPD